MCRWCRDVAPYRFGQYAQGWRDCQRPARWAAHAAGRETKQREERQKQSTIPTHTEFLFRQSQRIDDSETLRLRKQFYAALPVQHARRCRRAIAATPCDPRELVTAAAQPIA